MTGRRLAVLAPPWAWLALFVALPLLVVLAISLAPTRDGIPPFAPLLTRHGWNGQVDDYVTLLTDPFYVAAFLRSVRIAGLSALACLLLGYPMALAIARSAPARRPILLMLVMLPFWTGFLLRITAWIGLLRDDGWINAALGLVHLHARLLYTDAALYIGLVYAYLPFMVLPLYARLAQQDRDVEAAAADLGAPPWRVFLAVTLPLSWPGVLAGLLLVFIPAVGEYVIPELLGGPGAQTIGRVLWGEFFDNHDWPMAATVAVGLIAVLLLPAALLQRQGGR